MELLDTINELEKNISIKLDSIDYDNLDNTKRNLLCNTIILLRDAIDYIDRVLE